MQTQRSAQTPGCFSWRKRNTPQSEDILSPLLSPIPQTSSFASTASLELDLSPEFLPCLRDVSQETPSTNPWGFKPGVKHALLIGAVLYGIAYYPLAMSGDDNIKKRLPFLANANWFFTLCAVSTCLVRIPFTYKTTLKFFPGQHHSTYAQKALIGAYVATAIPPALAFVPTMRAGLESLSIHNNSLFLGASSYVVFYRCYSMAAAAPAAPQKLLRAFRKTFGLQDPDAQKSSTLNTQVGSMADRLSAFLKLSLPNQESWVDSRSFQTVSNLVVIFFCLVHGLNSFKNTSQGVEALWDLLNVSPEWRHSSLCSYLSNTYAVLGTVNLALFQFTTVQEGFQVTFATLANKNGIRDRLYAQRSVLPSAILAGSALLLLLGGVGIVSQLEEGGDENDLLLRILKIAALKVAVAFSAAAMNSIFQYIMPLTCTNYDAMHHVFGMDYPDLSRPQTPLDLYLEEGGELGSRLIHTTEELESSNHTEVA
jgi:hypothetical protein